jgi:hypothetical protein
VRPDSLFEDLELKDGEKWKLFKGRDARKDLPKWGQCKMCPKWHVKGQCFNDCPDAASHVPKKDVSVEKHGEMLAWKKSKLA